MEKKKHHRRPVGPPRIPADIRNSAVETHFAKSQAVGGYRSLGASAGRSGSPGRLPKEQPPIHVAKEVYFQSSPGRLGTEGGAEDDQGAQASLASPALTPPAPQRVPSSLRSRAFRRSISAGEKSTSGAGGSVEAIAACSALIAKVMRLEQGQQERGAPGGSPSPSGRGRIIGPPLTRRVSASAFPLNTGGNGSGAQRFFTGSRSRGSGSIGSTGGGSSNDGRSMAPAARTAGKQAISSNRVDNDSDSDSDSNSNSSSSSSSSGNNSSTGSSSGSDAAPATVSINETSIGDGGGRKCKSSSATFYDYWSYYSSRPTSVIRSGTRELVDDILSSASDDCTVSAPTPSPRVTITTTTTTVARPHPTEAEAVRKGGSTAVALTDAFVARGGVSDGGNKTQAEHMLVRAGGGATGPEQRAKDIKLRLEELRTHSENSRCADCSAPCADWASIAHACFVCLNCAERHRDLGMHVTFTRSLTMDKWTEGSLCLMEAGGNTKLAAFVRRIGLYPWSAIEDKYTHPCLQLYRKHIAALADGEEPPPLSREALEQAVLIASGEEASHDENRDDNTSGGKGEGGSGRSNNSESETFKAPLESFVRNVGNGCGGLSNALRQWSCNGGIVGRRTPAEAKGRGRVETVAGEVAGGGGPPRWIPDDEKDACMVCERRFSLVLWRHHCRRCGRLSCAMCAPADNTRPIVEWGFSEAVRHCRLCYRSPLLEWPECPSD